MEFFNKKEEVIDLQLTQYGKELLAVGKLKPVYYAFYDDNILYDIGYGLSSEIQNDSESRIQDDTPNLKTQYVFHGIEEYVAEATITNPYDMKILEYEAMREQLIRDIQAGANPGRANITDVVALTNKINELQNADILTDIFTGETTATAERTQTLYNPLGDSDLGSNKAPSWNIALLSGKVLTGSTTQHLTLSGSNTILDIPQISVFVTYDASVSETQDTHISEIIEEVIKGNIDGVPQDILESQLTAAGSPGLNETSIDDKVFSDNTFLKISPDDLILQVVEDNVPLSNKNFEVEIFEVESVSLSGKAAGTQDITKLKPLQFLNDPELVINDILLDPEEVNNGTVPDLNPTMVDYYFDVESDSEINAAVLCAKIENADKDLYKYASKDFDCEDVRANYQFLDPYAQKSGENDCDGER